MTDLLGSNNKLDKQSPRAGPYVLRGLSLAPANLSGYEMCPMRTEGCTKACIGVKSGHNRFGPAKEAKIRRTKMYVEDNYGFMVQLFREMDNLCRYCERKGKLPVVRLNTYSDVVWEHKHPEIFEEFPEVQFYDYTKIDKRGPQYMKNPEDWPENYHLTLSSTGENWDDCLRWLEWGQQVAVVFKDCWDNPLPKTWRGYPVVDGDKDDCRWMEDPGVIVGLRTKGSVKHAGPFFANPKESALTIMGRHYVPKETTNGSI
jgi:hypothetical protein